MSKTQVARPRTKHSTAGKIAGAVAKKRRQHTVHSPMQNVVYWGRILETLYNRQFMSEMRPYRTTISIWRILTALNTKDALTINEIAARSHIERTVASRLLDRMESEGLIERSPNPVDRRITDTRMTTKGRSLFQHMRPVRERVYTRATNGIEPQRLELACQIITEMIRNLGGEELLIPTYT